MMIRFGMPFLWANGSHGIKEWLSEAIAVGHYIKMILLVENAKQYRTFWSHVLQIQAKGHPAMQQCRERLKRTLL